MFFLNEKLYSQDFEYKYRVSVQNKLSVNFSLKDENYFIFTTSYDSSGSCSVLTHLSFDKFKTFLSAISRYSFYNSSELIFGAEFTKYRQTIYLPNFGWFRENCDLINLGMIFDAGYFKLHKIDYVQIEVTLFYYTDYYYTDYYCDNLQLNQKSFDLQKCLRQSYDLNSFLLENSNSIDNNTIAPNINSLMEKYKTIRE